MGKLTWCESAWHSKQDACFPTEYVCKLDPMVSVTLKQFHTGDRVTNLQ